LIMAVPTQTINHTVAKYVSDLQGKGKTHQIKSFIHKVIKTASIYGIIACIVFIAFSKFIKEFLHLNSIIPILLLGIFFLFSFLAPIAQGGLRGLQKFHILSFSGVFRVVLKILFAILLVYWGWGIEGALIALIFSTIIFIVYSHLKFKLPKQKENLEINILEVFTFAKSAFWATLCLVVLYNIDIILAKHFLSAEEAGYYAIIALLGKIIFFATGSVGTVIFPIAAKNHAQGKENKRLLKLSLSIVGLISTIITFVYFIFPKFVVKTLFGASYLAIVPYTGLIGVIFILFSIINILVLYHLSIKRTDFIFILLIGTALEVGLLSYFHQDIKQILTCLISAMTLILISLIIYLKFKPCPAQIKNNV